jgi:hypothetical protein
MRKHRALKKKFHQNKNPLSTKKSLEINDFSNKYLSDLLLGKNKFFFWF